jgi:hypothetical protein
VAEEEFSAGEICVSSKAAIGMPAADGDESTRAAYFCVKVHDGCERD